MGSLIDPTTLGWFFIDLFASFPFDRIVDELSTRQRKSVKISKVALTLHQTTNTHCTYTHHTHAYAQLTRL